MTPASVEQNHDNPATIATYARGRGVRHDAKVDRVPAMNARDLKKELSQLG